MWNVIAGLALNKIKQNEQEDFNNQQQRLAENSMATQNILQKRYQRKQVADSIGKNNVDIDSIVGSLFPNKKRNASVGGFGNYGFF